LNDPKSYEPGNWFQFGLGGILAFLIYLLLKYIKQRDRAEQSSAQQRSERYRDDNKIRDEKYIEALGGVTRTLEKIDKDGDKFIGAMNDIVTAGSENYNGAIEKFVQLVNRVMEQSNFQTQTLIELKTIVAKLPSEFQSLKSDINKHLQNLVMSYDLTKKEDE
jgi:hypothetical protein